MKGMSNKSTWNASTVMLNTLIFLSCPADCKLNPQLSESAKMTNIIIKSSLAKDLRLYLHSKIRRKINYEYLGNFYRLYDP